MDGPSLKNDLLLSEAMRYAAIDEAISYSGDVDSYDILFTPLSNKIDLRYLSDALRKSKGGKRNSESELDQMYILRKYQAVNCTTKSPIYNHGHKTKAYPTITIISKSDHTVHSYGDELVLRISTVEAFENNQNHDNSQIPRDHSHVVTGDDNEDASGLFYERTIAKMGESLTFSKELVKIKIGVIRVKDCNRIKLLEEKQKILNFRKTDIYSSSEFPPNYSNMFRLRFELFKRNNAIEKLCTKYSDNVYNADDKSFFTPTINEISKANSPITGGEEIKIKGKIPKDADVMFTLDHPKMMGILVKGDVTFAKDDFLIFKTPDISATAVANCSKIVNAKIFLHKILPCGKADTCDKRNFCFYPVDGQINTTTSSSNPPSFMEVEMDQSGENDKIEENFFNSDPTPQYQSEKIQETVNASTSYVLPPKPFIVQEQPQPFGCIENVCQQNQQKLHDMELQLQEALQRIKWLEENHWTSLPNPDITPFIPQTPNHNNGSTDNAESLLTSNGSSTRSRNLSLSFHHPSHHHPDELNGSDLATINSADCKDILSFCSNILPRSADAIGEDNPKTEEIPKKSPMPQRKRVNQNPGGITDGSIQNPNVVQWSFEETTENCRLIRQLSENVENMNLNNEDPKKTFHVL